VQLCPCFKREKKTLGTNTQNKTKPQKISIKLAANMGVLGCTGKQLQRTPFLAVCRGLRNTCAAIQKARVPTSPHAKAHAPMYNHVCTE
jgi:hypothetical protein